MKLILLVVAIVLFVISALRTTAGPINLLALGLAFFAAYFIPALAR